MVLDGVAHGRTCDDLLCNRAPLKQSTTTKQGGSPSKMPRNGEAGRMAPLSYAGGVVDDEDEKSRDLVRDAAVALAEVRDSLLVFQYLAHQYVHVEWTHV
jgi:hypothetical protein